MSLEMAWRAASLTSADAGKSGNPCAMLTASYFMARRVISRITDSVNRAALADSVRCTAAATLLDPVVDASPALNGSLPFRRDAVHLWQRAMRRAARPRFSRRLFSGGAPAAGLQKERDRTLDGKRPNCESRSARTPLSP